MEKVVDPIVRVTSRAVALAALAVILLPGCGTNSNPAIEPAPSPTAATSSPEDRHLHVDVDDPGAAYPQGEARLIDVGHGRSVSATCWGSGSPAVVFLHGLIMRGDTDKWAHAAELQERIPSETTYCEYERVNVGHSSKVDGPFPVTDTVADLHGLIGGLGLDAPVVLVGGSFGGLIAYTYAGTHPEDVAGVVLLDPTLHAEDEIEKALLPESVWLPYEAWADTREQIDLLGAYPIARDALTRTPAVPGTIFVTESLYAPDPNSAEEFRSGIRQMQADLIAHFHPSQMITVDTPHAMLPVVPDQIAAEVLAFVEARR